MALRGVKPEYIPKRLKVLFYGQSGVGKTKAAIQFPTPYLIDTEKGTEHKQYKDALTKVKGVVFTTTDFDEILAEVEDLLRQKHEFKTLIIDSFTIIYQGLCDKWAAKLAKQSKDANSDGTEFQRHRDKADIQVKQLLRLILRLDMNVIITSHSKIHWIKNGKELVDGGHTFDCYKKLDYLFDLVFEVRALGEKDSIGIVKKSRVENFIRGETFPFTYEEIAKRYGKEILEKDAKIENLATLDQIKEITHLIEILHVPDETYQKWLDKAQANQWSDMPYELIQKCISSLKAKLQGEAA